MQLCYYIFVVDDDRNIHHRQMFQIYIDIKK